MGKINIEGESPKKTYELDEVKNNVVKIGTKYFWRDSRDIVSVITSKGRRYRRKMSPLIARLQHNSTYADVSDIVRNKSGMMLNSADPETIKVDGDWTTKAFCVEIEKGRWVLASDPALVTTVEGLIRPKKDVVKLSSTYPKESWCLEANAMDELGTGELLYRDDTCYLMMVETGEVGYVNVRGDEYRKLMRRNSFNVFLKFSEHNSGDPSRVLMVNCYATQHMVTKKFSELSDDYPLLVHNSMVESIKATHKYWLDNHIKDNTNKIRKRLNTRFADADPTENVAKEINLDYGTQPGGHVFHRTDRKNIMSNCKAKTGGIGYTFGVEFETAAGQLSNLNCSKIKVDKIGDRSIGAYEYVSGVLHGSDGMNQVEKICKTLSQKTLLDDKCSIHVHVGGNSDKRSTTPKFSTRLSILLIALGAKIEESLYSMCPPSRSRKVKHCAPIDRWGHITVKNHDNLLGSFLFGGDRNGKISDRAIESDDYSFKRVGPQRATGSSKWHGARYKWLNLLNCHTNRGFSTIEIRMWSASCNYEKVSAYVLLSLAFVWFAENKAAEIQANKTITIVDVVNAAFSKKPEIKATLLAFIDKRTKQFEQIRKTRKV